jgi:hypothetical protein
VFITGRLKYYGGIVRFHIWNLAKLTNYSLNGLLIIAGLASIAWAGFLMWMVFKLIWMGINPLEYGN